MKKILFLCCSLAYICANAQFTLTSEGWATEEGKSFYVVEIPGSKQELFDKAKTCLTLLYNSPKDVLSFSAPDVVSISGFTDAPYFKQMGVKYPIETFYTMTIRFKEGRIRFDAPNINNLEVYNKSKRFPIYLGKGGGMGISDMGYIFKKDGKVRYKDAQRTIEEYFNNLVNTIASKIQTPVVEEGW